MADPTGAYLLSNRRGAPSLWRRSTVQQIWHCAHTHTLKSSTQKWFQTHTHASFFPPFKFTQGRPDTRCIQRALYHVVTCTVVHVGLHQLMLLQSGLGVLCSRIHYSVNTVSCCPSGAPRQLFVWAPHTLALAVYICTCCGCVWRESGMCFLHCVRDNQFYVSASWWDVYDFQYAALLLALGTALFVWWPLICRSAVNILGSGHQNLKYFFSLNAELVEIAFYIIKQE